MGFSDDDSYSASSDDEELTVAVARGDTEGPPVKRGKQKASFFGAGEPSSAAGPIANKFAGYCADAEPPIKSPERPRY